MQVLWLITELAETGRAASDEELQQLREHVARAGFDPDARERVRGRGAGIVWRGQTLRGSHTLPPDEAHYVRHVLGRPEWPSHTTFQDYLRSITEVVSNISGGVFVSSTESTFNSDLSRRRAHGKEPRAEPGLW